MQDTEKCGVLNLMKVQEPSLKGTLGFHSSLHTGALPLRRAFFGPGAGPVLITDIVFCNGFEGRLTDCAGAVISEIDIPQDDINRLHELDVGVRCEGKCILIIGDKS